MYTGKRLGEAIQSAIRKKIDSGAVNSKVEVARIFGVKPPSLHDWEQRGTIGKRHLPMLFSYFSDVVTPEHWGLETENVKEFPIAKNNSSLALYKANDIQIPQYSSDDVSGSMGYGFEFPEREDVIRNWRVSRAWAFNNIPANTGYNNLRIITGIGDSMQPLFNDGDLLLVDTGVKILDREGVFFFRVDNEGYIKRLQRIPSSKGLIIRAMSENRELYQSFDIDEHMNFAVLGRILKVWCGRNV